MSCGFGSCERDYGFGESNQVSQLGLGTDRVGGCDYDAEGEEGEIEYGDVQGRRREDECHVAFGEVRGEGLEGVGEGYNLAEEEGVGEVAVGGGVDEDGGGGDGGGGEEGEGVVGEGERLGGWRERDVWTEAVEGSGLRGETGV